MANAILYGFHTLEDIFSERVTASNMEVVNTAIERAVAEHTRQTDAILELFVTRTERAQRRYKTQVGARLQPLDEFGRARPIQTYGLYDTGFPIKDAGTALGQTFKAKAKQTVEDVQRDVATMLIADKTWLRDQIMGALFTNVAYDYDDPEDGTVSVKPLAITSDGQTYTRVGGLSSSTDQHFLAQANAIDDGADDPTEAMIAELREHPDNSGEMIIFVPTANVAAVQALTNFYEDIDPDITVGTGVSRLTGSLTAALPGPVLGKHAAGAWYVEWASLPSNYLVGIMNQSEKPLAMREEPEAVLKGFYKVPQDRNDHPYYEQQWARHCGFGAWNRVGAVVQRVGNGTYAIPTGYSQPMP